MSYIIIKEEISEQYMHDSFGTMYRYKALVRDEKTGEEGIKYCAFEEAHLEALTDAFPKSMPKGGRALILGRAELKRALQKEGFQLLGDKPKEKAPEVMKPKEPIEYISKVRPPSG